MEKKKPLSLIIQVNPSSTSFFIMLTSTFCHIPGIGYSTEEKLWDQGITSWQKLSENINIVPRVSGYDIAKILEESINALEHDPLYFSKKLKSRDGWRLFPHFRNQSAYLDIETTGLGDDAEITTIALYDGFEVKTYVNGRNLDSFLADIDQIKVFITYNGISFDIPFIERYFRTTLPQAQIDLRYILAQLGCRGGLKGCEKQFGINRGTLDGIDGSFAVVLWHEYYRYNNEAALETLLSYNLEDTVNLEKLMVEAYNRNADMVPFGQELQLPYPESPPLPYQPDPMIVDKVRRQFGHGY